MPTIEISDHNDFSLSFDMIDILTVLEPSAHELDWYFIEFVSAVLVGATDPEPNVKPWVIALLHQIEKSKTSFRVPWDTLKDFARNVIQTEMALLIGVRPGNSEPVHPLDLNSEDFEIVLQGVDTSFWAVTTRNEAIIDRLRLRFKSTQTVQGATLYF